MAESPRGLGKSGFIESMLQLHCDELHRGSDWLSELKLDGHRAVAFKAAGKVHVRFLNDNDFDSKCTAIVKRWRIAPDEAVIDGEIVASRLCPVRA